MFEELFDNVLHGSIDGIRNLITVATLVPTRWRGVPNSKGKRGRLYETSPSDVSISKPMTKPRVMKVTLTKTIG